MRLTIELNNLSELEQVIQLLQSLNIKEVNVLPAVESATVTTLEEISIDTATSILNVSVSYVQQLLDEQKIPYRMEGGHHYLPLKAVQDYHAAMKKIRLEQLDFLAKEAQELNLGY